MTEVAEKLLSRKKKSVRLHRTLFVVIVAFDWR